MRPLRLVMTGFESYKDRTEINFEELGIKGLYLITGDTGAGKTTIFDAITFALYGSPSGTDRSVEMLRSHFADENTPTIVELDFETNGKKYHITRNPDYERKALRGTGTTKESGNAILTCLSESKEPISGINKVNAEIENLLKLKKDQFCSIAMIAQGRFQQLLLSDKDKKERIFRDLFHTEKYALLQEKLKSDKSEAENSFKELKLKLQEAVKSIEITPEDKDFEKINEIKTNFYIKQEELQLLQSFITKDEKLFSEILNQTDNIENKLEKTTAELQIGENRQKIENQLKLSEEALKNKTDLISSLEKEVLAAQNEAEQVPEMEKEKTLIEASLQKYQEIVEEEKENFSIQQNIEEDKNKLDSTKNEIDLLSKKSEEIKKEQLSLKSAGEKIGTLQAALENISKIQDDLNEIFENFKKLSEEKKSLCEAQKKVQFADKDFTEASNLYTEKLHLFNLEQAGILAANLAEGCACPVCGSTAHPHLAKKSENAPTQQEIENLKKTTDLLQNKFSSVSMEAAQKKTAVEKSEDSINKQLKKHFTDVTVSSPEFERILKTRQSELLEQSENTETELKKEIKDKNRLEEIERMLPDFEKELKEKESCFNELVKIISNNTVLLDTKNQSLKEKKAGLKFKTLQEAQSQFTLLEKQILTLNSKVEKAKENKNNCEKEIEKIRGESDGLKTQLQETKPVDMEKLYAKKQELTEKKSALNAQRDSLNKRKGINQDCINKIESLIPKIEAAENKRNMIASLCETALGSGRGKNGKPSLETYVQMYCLDQINHRANLRLKKMTENKYELHRRIEVDGAQLGLDLDVKDFYTGRSRGVQTLSGGEQFQASLALALGLADHIQDASGGIKLDTMFIDEGFGTLDNETLNKAMHALEDLSQGNKLVGIISHVEELESRIDNKIVVTKNPAGISSAVIKKD